MHKLPNWDTELIRFCEAMRAQGIVFSFSDCVMFAAGGVEVETGVELTREHVGKYATLEEARAYMHSKGWADVDDVADAYLPRIMVTQRKRGDILGFIGPRGKGLGICLGKWAMVMTPEGATQYPSSRAFAAWRVGVA